MLFSNTKDQKKSISKKILATLLLSGLMLMQGVTLAATSQTVNLLAFGADTTAGSPTFLKVKDLEPNQQVNFVVNKPNGLVLTLAAQAGQNGVAQTELYDYHTQVAGTYQVSAVLPGNTASINNAVKTNFKVFADDTDADKSIVEVDRAVLKAGDDSAKVTVSLKDQYNNAISGRSVKLIPSRASDQVQESSQLTNELGQAVFTVSSAVAGAANFSAMDMTDDKLIISRAAVSFVEGDNYLANSGGDFIKVAKAAEPGPLAAFDITDFPTSVKPNENVSFKVKAVDASDQIVQDYTGTIRFSAEGDNAAGVTLPANYKFLASDLGVHTFNLGISFNKAGTYKVDVNDLNDKFKQGQVTVVVADGSSGNTNTGTSTTKSVITAPTPGTYSQAQQTISGTAKGSSTVTIYDNSQQIGTVPVGPTGKFSFQTGDLADGKHSIYVVNTDTITTLVISNSDPVEINIDTTPPKIDQMILDPATGIKPGDNINVKIYSEKNLAQAAVTFNFDIVPLTVSPTDPTLYLGTIQAPKDPGSYSMNVLLVDELHNEGNYDNQAKINVDAAGGLVENNTNTTTTPTPTDTTTTPTDTATTTPVVSNPPSQVNGLIAYGSDKRITLVWDASTDDKQVKNYKIYYGQDLKNMAQSVATKDASTTWYVPNLENGKEYFFAVTAIDDQGNESAAKSEIVSGIPFMLEIKNNLTDTPTKPIATNDLHGAAYNGPFPTQTTKTGPEVDLLLFGSVAVSGALSLLKKKK